MNHKTITRTWIATDECGNTNSVIQIITIDDSIPPQITCPLVTVDCAIPQLDFYQNLQEFLNAGGYVFDNCQLDSTSWKLISEVISTPGYPEPYLITRTYTISDVCGNSSTCVQTVSVPGVLDIQAKITDVDCYGNSNGEIDLTVTGGTPLYTFAWNTGQTSEDLSGIQTGMYTVTVTDENGCVIVKTFEIKENDELILTLSRQT